METIKDPMIDQVTDPGEIDLTRHALIEASAGTGKTYTIENLVVRLIVERTDITVENILLVTFTEKAASELKVRIREKIAQQFQANAKNSIAENRRLKAALDGFDQAAVFTIHGFCQNLLTELAFENNALFENELKEDHAIYDSLLRDQIRRVWPARYGADLSELLRLCGFADQKERMLEKIIRIAVGFSPAAGDRLIPQPPHNDYAQFKSHLENKAQYLQGLLTGPPLFSETYAKLNLNSRTRNMLIEKVIRPLETFFSERPGQALDLCGLSVLFKAIGEVKSNQIKGISALTPSKWLKAGPNPEVCPDLEAVTAAVLELQQQFSVAAHWIARATIFDLKTAVSQKKEQHGWISFDDMLVRVYLALNSEKAPLLLNRLREKYKIAFVDEFQDTDPIQWRIFKRIFIDDPDHRSINPLVLIGDPKQAIYSFRGADVYAYLEARLAMADLAAKDLANLYSLCHNWRSLPEMVQNFNQLFSQEQWFSNQSGSNQFNIGYTEALSPGREQLPLKTAKDETGRKSLNLVDLRSRASSRQAKKMLARFIASEIDRLVAGGLLWIASKERARQLDHGDIAILVRGKSEAAHIEAALSDAGVPYSFYKKPGLFKSEQAEALSLVLHAIMNPADGEKVKKALLTPFFDADPLFLYTYSDLPMTHPVRQLLLGWNELALKRQWRPLFQALMERSGLTFRLAPQPDWDRVHTNFSQLFEVLESEAYRRNLDLRALIALLDGYRGRTMLAGEGADIHQIETEARKVQIMTMHVSKGLQFPVVFVAGGLTRPAQSGFQSFHQVNKQDSEKRIERLFDLANQHSDEHQKEQDDEDRRLFYVALTRAQIKLYLPYYPVSTAQSWVGPLSKFVAASIQAAFDPELDFEDESFVVTWIRPEADQTERQGSDVTIKNNQIPSNGTKIGALGLLPEDDFRGRRIDVNSFSSLAAALFHPAHPYLEPEFQPNLGPEKELNDGWEEIGLGAPGMQGAIDNPLDLPGGTQMGSMLHAILEQIDYGLVRNTPAEILDNPRVQAVIDRNLSRYRIAGQWREHVAQVVAAALTTPIAIKGKRLVLGDLTKNERLHEVEFYFPYIWEKRLPPTDAQNRFYIDCDGYVRGYIDLIFRFEERYYLADWKSNYLAKGYGPEALKDSMDQAGYHLQYRIYSIALLRWLEQAFGGVSKAVDLFGGVFYFYLRGMGAADQNGIFYISPKQLGTRRALEQELERVLRRVR